MTDGHGVLSRIRSSDGGSDLPVIMLTAAADDAHAWQAWSGGVDYFLAKPFDPSELLRYLDYLFDGAARPYRIGDRLEVVVPHCDPVVNLYDVIHVVRADRVVDVWPIDARGRSQ